MKINKIKIGNNLFVEEYVLQSDNSKKLIKSISLKGKIYKKELSSDDFVSLYKNEDLAKVGNKVYPFIILCDFDIDDLSKHYMYPSTTNFKIPERFRLFRKGVLEYKLQKDVFDGKRIGVHNYIIDKKIVNIYSRQAGYFDFIATNISMDDYLCQFDPSFAKGQTLRDYEIVNNKLINPLNSNMANILGTASIVIPKEEENCILLGKRGAGLVIAGGALSCISGTPGWREEWNNTKNGKVRLKKVLYQDVQKELKEELCLEPNEIKIIGGYFMNELLRAPLYVLIVKVDAPAKEIAIRASQDEEARKEHSRLYKIPLHPEALQNLSKKSQCKIYIATELFFHLARRKILNAC